MDQVKIGKFIAQCRNEKKITQYNCLASSYRCIKITKCRRLFNRNYIWNISSFFYVVRYNQMMIYVEDRVYKKIEK